MMRLYHLVMSRTSSHPPGRWLVLVHQIPPKPAYLRVKIGRRLSRIGAVALKNTVYVLPRSDEALEDLQWVLREVVSSGGEAALLEGRLLDGFTDDDVEGLFRAARDSDYGALADEIRALEARCLEAAAEAEKGRPTEAEVERLERRFQDISSIDHFGAEGRETTHGLLEALRARLSPDTTAPSSVPRADQGEYRARTWVTRAGVKVDRIASAWLVRRFVDREATFKFVPATGYEPAAGELRFDMFQGEFTHEGDRCTFEVLCERFGLSTPGLRAIGELIHDLDVKDGKYGRPEAPGLAAQIAGLANRHADDATRIERGEELFDDLLAHFATRGD